MACPLLRKGGHNDAVKLLLIDSTEENTLL